MSFDSGIWTEFCKELHARTGQLTGEFAGAWRDIAALTAAQRESFESLPMPPRPADRPQVLEAFFAEASPTLLTEPLALYGQRRPLQRCLAALENHEAVLDDLLRRLPKTTEISGRGLIEICSADRRPRVASWRALQTKPRTVQLRDAVEDHLQRVILGRAALDGAFQLLMAQASLHLLTPWQMWRRAFLTGLVQSGLPQPALDGARQWWNTAAARHDQRAAVLLEQYETWSGSISASLADAFLRRPYPASQRKSEKRADTHRKQFSFWSRQQRAVRSVIDLELHLASLARATVRETIASLESLDTEHAELVQELEIAIAWLEQWPASQDGESFPQPRARLLSSEERLTEWLRRVSARTREELPVTIETVEPHRALPGFRKPWRDLEPARVFLGALSTGAPVLLGGLREVEAVHRGVVREIERAREVVDFGIETARLEHGAGEEYAREAVRNALTLLTYQKGAAPDTHAAVEPGAARAAAALLLDADIALEKGRIGLLAHVTRQRGGEALRQLRTLTERGLQAGSRQAWAATRRGYRWSMLKIGLVAPHPPVAAPVVRRADLADTLDVQLRARELPMIYRRLFRLAPVEDPRFLVGRDAEMSGFADALKRWEGGKGSSVIVVGARGSGKTSLINCAISGVFPHCDVVRGQFCERMLDPAAMTDFVRGLLQVPPGEDLNTALAQHRRVILVEEFERTYLRAVNGFDALRALLDLVYSTGRSTLWVFSVNETAYRYLDAVVGLGRHFSHHINAMSVRQEDLTNAILQRHGLSGLRLEFAPLPGEDPRVSGVRRFLGFEQDPQRLFLDALYEQSEGIFRSAFELWQGSIERVEGGVVHMRQPLAPDYLTLSAEMTLEDCFALKAILQHGSLTAAELAVILATGREESIRQLERLQLLEVLEPEPSSPGLRVRPEAGRLVRETLSRRNLL
jgi:hypothetical protein